MDELKKTIIKYEVEDYSLYSRECCKSIERIEGIERSLNSWQKVYF